MDKIAEFRRLLNEARGGQFGGSVSNSSPSPIFQLGALESEVPQYEIRDPAVFLTDLEEDFDAEAPDEHHERTPDAQWLVEDLRTHRCCTRDCLASLDFQTCLSLRVDYTQLDRRSRKVWLLRHLELSAWPQQLRYVCDQARRVIVGFSKDAYYSCVNLLAETGSIEAAIRSVYQHVQHRQSSPVTGEMMGWIHSVCDLFFCLSEKPFAVFQQSRQRARSCESCLLLVCVLVGQGALREVLRRSEQAAADSR
jgi:hypothetical protein